jgi:heptosyltransferase-2
LSAAGAGDPKKIVAFVAGSANSPEKRWPAKNFAMLANRLRQELSADIILIGASDEADVSDPVIQGIDHKPIDLTGKTSLGEAAAILSVVDLVITNDTGLAHVAPAVGTPTLVIFGPTNPDTTRPYSPLAQVMQKKPSNGRGVEWPAVDEVFVAAATRLQEEVDDEAPSDIS